MSTERDAEELFFDALDAAEEGGYAHRGSGIVDMQAADIVKALLKAGWAPPTPPNPNERVVEVDTVTIHKYVSGQDTRASVSVDPDTLGEELGRVEVGNSRHVSYSSGQQVWVYGVAWVGDVAIYRFEAVIIPPGSDYQVGPFPLVMTLT